MATKRRPSNGIKREEGIWEQLMRLRAMTWEMGVLHEAQANQLKLWGPLALPHAHDIEIGVGLPHMDSKEKGLVDVNVVEYRASATSPPPKNLRNLLGGLQRSVAALLGDYFTLTVKINGNAIFHRKGKAKKKRNLAKLMKRLVDADGSE